MKIGDLDRLYKGDIIVFSEDAGHDPSLIGYYGGDTFEFISINNLVGSVTSINLKGLNKIGTLNKGHIHYFNLGICKHMCCSRLVREDKLEELGI